MDHLKEKHILFTMTTKLKILSIVNKFMDNKKRHAWVKLVSDENASKVTCFTCKHMQRKRAAVRISSEAAMGMKRCNIIFLGLIKCGRWRPVLSIAGSSMVSVLIGINPGRLGSNVPPDFGVDGSWGLHGIVLYPRMYRNMR